MSFGTCNCSPLAIKVREQMFAQKIFKLESKTKNA